MSHTCHWPGCTAAVPPAMWGCKAHWFSLPKRLRDEIWRTYRRGQEVTKTPSAEYIKAANEVRDWIVAYQAAQRGQGHKPQSQDNRANPCIDFLRDSADEIEAKMRQRASSPSPQPDPLTDIDGHPVRSHNGASDWEMGR